MSSTNQRDILSTLAGPSPEGFTTRPVIMGTHGMVTSGHYIASRIGIYILEQGGNAVDAAVAMGFALAVLEPYLFGIGGEIPMLIYLANHKKVVAISGQGYAPRNATIEWFKKQGFEQIPGDGLLAATVPDAVSSLIIALMHFGTKSLAEVLEPAIELAEKGFPVYGILSSAIQRNAERFQEAWPSSAEVFLPNGRAPLYGEILTQPDLSNVFKKLVQAEQKELKRGRIEALQSAHDAFYKGEIAEKIIEFIQNNAFLDSTGKRNHGLLTKEDLAGYKARIEEPVSVEYRGYEVYKCGPWTQGPVFLQQLTLLEGYDLVSLGHNSAEYIHLLVEVAKLAFADREKYYGDPDFVKVPLDVLLSKEYAAERRKLIDPDHASMELRPGNAESFKPEVKKKDKDVYTGDTTHLDVVDRYGNMVAATPSGGWFASSPVIKGLGFPLGTRLQVFYLDPQHPNSLQPGKRPRTTLTPSLVLKEGKPFMVFGTPGGDQQDQWTLQFFINCVDFNMNLQAAVDAPTFHSAHFPASFYPHGAQPGVVIIEKRINESTIKELEAKGHKVQLTGPWANGRVVGIRFDSENGLLLGVASPRMETGYAIGW